METPSRAIATVNPLLVSLRGVKMFDKDGNYIPNDEEAIEFEEFDMEEE